MNDDVEIVHIITEPTRFAILCLLIDHNYCVRALARKLNISEPAISQHMNVFKRYDLVTWKKLGYQVHYHVKRERVVQALSGLTSGSMSLPPLTGNLWLVGAAFGVLFLPLLPFKSLLPAAFTEALKIEEGDNT